MQQRKKISTPVYFPLTLSEAEIKSNGNSNVNYKLSSVLIHLGTASGGHYKAYIYSKGKWYEYDDANVLELSDDDVKKLFWCTSPQDVEAKNTGEPTDLIMKGFSIYEGAYMLVYQVDNANTAAEESFEIVSSIPSEIVQEVKSANEQLAVLRRANEVHKLMTELSCFKINADSGSHVKPSNITLTPVTCHLIGLKSLNDALEMIYDAFVKNGVINPSEVTISMCRLRRYNPSSRMVGETFTSKESSSLTDLGLSPLSSLAMEVLSPGGTFTDFNPKEVEVRLLEWKDNKLPIQDDGHSDIFINVVGEENATVGGLRSKVAEYYQISDINRIILAKNDVKSSYLELSEDASLLTSGYNVHSGDDVIVCILPDGQSRFNGKGIEVTKALQAQKRSITIFYNTPSNTNEGEGFGGATYGHSIAVSLDETLGDLKKSLGQALNMSVDTFYLRRNANSPQLKKLNKSLDEIGFVDQGIVHIQVIFSLFLPSHLFIFVVRTTNRSR